ncbi:MAG: hypothetical protein IJO93_05555 [Clostridia bacterium]|nr:hypothetical protein [Clostridia bacterium]
MLIVIYGESCTGKSTVAEIVGEKINAKIICGKDYLRMAKSEHEAECAFTEKLKTAVSGDENIIYVFAEPELARLLPCGAFSVYVKASIDTVLERFRKRMHGNMPDAVKNMLIKKHGCFEKFTHDMTLCTDELQSEDCAEQILNKIKTITGD